MSSSEAAEQVGITRAAARRSLLTLCGLGYARFDGKYFTLQPRILELGYNYLSSLRLPALVQPMLDAVSARAQESSSAAILDGTDVVYVARSARRRLTSIDIGVGTQLPAYCTSLGRVLLAFGEPSGVDAYFKVARTDKLTARTVTDEAALRRIIGEVRETGHSIVDEELEIGLRSMSVPCFDRRGRCVCAVNISVSSARMTVTQMRTQLLPILAEARDRANYLIDER